jgi:hypothetical protein
MPRRAPSGARLFFAPCFGAMAGITFPARRGCEENAVRRSRLRSDLARQPVRHKPATGLCRDVSRTWPRQTGPGHPGTSSGNWQRIFLPRPAALTAGIPDAASGVGGRAFRTRPAAPEAGRDRDAANPAFDIGAAGRSPDRAAGMACPRPPGHSPGWKGRSWRDSRPAGGERREGSGRSPLTHGTAPRLVPATPVPLAPYADARPMAAPTHPSLAPSKGGMCTDARARPSPCRLAQRPNAKRGKARHTRALPR